MSEPRPALSGVLRYARPSGPLLGLLTLLGLFALLLWWQGQLRHFLNIDNLLVVLHGGSVPAVAALGMLLIVLTGGIDLSVGSVMALSAVVTMQTYRLVYNGAAAGLPALVVGWLREEDLLWGGSRAAGPAGLCAVAAGLLVGTLAGLCNGLMITRLHVSPFVATLGMLSAARGLAIWLSNRTQVSFLGPTPEWVTSLARVRSPSVFFNPGVWSVVALAAFVWVLLRFTVHGRHVYAIGFNEATAWRCGVPVVRRKVLTYALAGVFTGWAGVLLFAQGNGADPNAAAGMELEVIAAVVIGGASLAGGQGTVMGTLLGVLILRVLENGVTQFNLPPEAKYVLIGVIVVANTALSAWQRRREE